MADNTKTADLTFPDGGIDQTGEYHEQPPGTTPEAINVRGLNPDSLRERGGSRAGLIRWIDTPLFAGADLIQHLNVIVDPQAEALGQNFETPGDDWTEDPLNPGTFIPPGGWGWPGGAPKVNLAFVQSAMSVADEDGGETTTTFSATPVLNTFMLAVVATLHAELNTTVTVKNGALNGYTQIGTYKRQVEFGLEKSLSLWWKKATDGASEALVKVTPSNTVDRVIGIMNFKGQHATSPIGPTANNSGNAATMTTGNMAASAKDAVIGAFMAALNPDTVTPGAGYTLQINHPDGSVDNTDIQLYVIYRILAAGGTENPQATLAGGADDFVALGLVIKD